MKHIDSIKIYDLAEYRKTLIQNLYNTMIEFHNNGGLNMAKVKTEIVGTSVILNEIRNGNGYLLVK